MGKPKDVFDEMAANWQKLLPEFRNKFGHYNCPLTAQAVFNYFTTGVVKAASAVTAPDTIQSCEDSEVKTVDEIVAMLRRGGHGTHGVVTATAPNKEHNANVANIRGQIYLVDAYNSTPVFTQDLKGHLSWATKLEFSWGWKMHMVPQHEKFTCPSPAPQERKPKKGGASPKHPPSANR